MKAMYQKTVSHLYNSATVFGQKVHHEREKKNLLKLFCYSIFLLSVKSYDSEIVFCVISCRLQPSTRNLKFSVQVPTQTRYQDMQRTSCTLRWRDRRFECRKRQAGV